ncbi:MAG: SGNH/GDSL hydrolase family protein [Acidimicrobiia bacterium]|nr:SGNH/GDSL hydrolase family protein [Acidimicrobiia bacterium]
MPGIKFHILVIGDSVPWGQGLKEGVKHHALVKEWILKFHPNFTVTHEMLAHSGAVIGVNAPTGQPFLDGEVPAAFPSILDQADRFQSDPAQTDLVIVNGGINDVDIRRIFNPFTKPGQISSLTRQHCFVDLKVLLHELHARFPNPKTRFLVCSYHLVLSRESDALRIPTFCAVFGIDLANSLLSLNPAARVIANAIQFWTESNPLIADAVDQVNAETSSKRFHLVKPPFTAGNAAFTKDPWVYGIKLNLQPQDEVIAERRQVCIRDEPDFLDRELCFRASAGHPNPKGAGAFFRATFPILKREFGL